MKDRGLIKWGAFVMPEHSKVLSNWKEEDEYESRVELFDDEIEEVNRILHEALETGIRLELKYYVSHLKKHKIVRCILVKYYPEMHAFRVRDYENFANLDIKTMDIAGVQKVVEGEC